MYGLKGSCDVEQRQPVRRRCCCYAVKSGYPVTGLNAPRAVLSPAGMAPSLSTPCLSSMTSTRLCLMRMLPGRRYRMNPAKMLAELRRRLKWADFALVKSELDEQVGRPTV